MKKLLLLGLIIGSTSLAQAQRRIESSSDILHEIKKLNVVGNALYIAAHPDDENTRLIAWLENKRLIRTAYLSLTRGDGGQNLIGTEKGDALGLLRTQELLEARNEDGAEQFFSRAVDFGYSKTADETLEIWDRKKVLADVVYTIRKFKPDVIITRFPPDERAGHGHHTASSILAEEAFMLAADPKAYPEQLEYVDTWQAKRILWDVYWWNTKLRDEAIASGGIVEVNIGEYNPLLGLSYSEIAADGRSQHKSQGFGSARGRGNKIEYLKHTAGEAATTDLFEGINTTWSRIDEGKKIGEKLDYIIANYDVNSPSNSVRSLVELYEMIVELNTPYDLTEKLKSLSNVIKAAAGIYVEFLAEEYNYPAFQLTPVKGNSTFLVRTGIPVSIKSISPEIDSTFEKITLGKNELSTFSFTHEIAIHPSNPYWLDRLIDDNSIGMSGMDDFITAWPQQYCMPMNLPVVNFNYVLNIAGVDVSYNQAIDYKWTDRVDGELHRDITVSPEVTASPTEKVFLFTKEEAQTIDVLLEANNDSIKNSIKLIAPDGWLVEPAEIAFELNFKGQQKSISFELTPPKESSAGEIIFQFDKNYAQAVQRVNYPHIKPQILFPWAKAKVVKMDLNRSVTKLGYIIGSGDDVALNLKQIGFDVNSFHAHELATMDLSQFETIIVGIRAYNTEESMKNGNDILNEYVKNGGTVIVQYNTNRGLLTEDIGPYRYNISRNRVTKEDANPTFLKPDHPLLNQPNKITMSDFDGWVQERGLYFADEWDEHYQTILAWNDPEEESQEGSVLVCEYGEGHFIFTGISFFRQLPAGVPGAYRLLTNMISYGK